MNTLSKESRSLIFVALLVASVAPFFLLGCDHDLGIVTTEPDMYYESGEFTLLYLSGQGYLDSQIFVSSALPISHRISGGPFDVQASWAPGKQWLVFTRGLPGGNFQLWKMNYDGSGKKLLTPPTANCQFPAVSPDGRSIAYVGMYTGKPDIYTTDTSGTEPFVIRSYSYLIPSADSLGFSSPTWSGDGKRLAFTLFPVGRDYYSSVGIIDVESGIYTRVTTADSLSPRQLHWNPAGDELVFVARARLYSIYRMNSDGSGITRLTDHYCFEPRFSPHGQFIAYSSDDSNFDGHRTIWMMDRTGERQFRIIQKEGQNCSGPAW